MKLPIFATGAWPGGSRVVVAALTVAAALAAFAALRFGPESPFTQQSGMAAIVRTPAAVFTPTPAADSLGENDRELAAYAPHGG